MRKTTEPDLNRTLCGKDPNTRQLQIESFTRSTQILRILNQVGKRLQAEQEARTTKTTLGALD